MNKKLLFALGCFFCIAFLKVKAQEINFPDTNLKDALLNHQPMIDTNNDGEIQIAEAANYNGDLVLPSSSIGDVTGLEYFNNVNILNLDYNNITNFEVDGLSSVTFLSIRYNNLIYLNVGYLSSLENLVLRENSLTYLDVSNNINLKYLNVRFNPLVELDVSYNINLEEITLTDLPAIEYINLKNGNNTNMSSIDPFTNMPAIQMVCVDDETTFLNNLYDLPTWGQPWFLVTTDCNFSLGQLNNINGSVNLDMGSGCGEASAVAVSNVLVETTVNGNQFGTLTNANGAYSLYTNEGANTATVVDIWSPWLTINPPSSSTSFTGFGNFSTIDFCMNPSSSFEDLNVTIVPTRDLIPGSITRYEIVIENLSSMNQTGNVLLTYDDSVQSFISASISPSATTSNTLEFDFSDLEPFHTEKIEVEFQNENATTLNDGDMVMMTAEIFPNTNDVEIEDNQFEIRHIAVTTANSNYIEILEGTEIYDTDIDQYLHDLVRFQNTGEENVQDLKIRDTLHENLDWTTFRIVSSSHSNYRVDIEGGNAVEISFEDINLPYVSVNDETSRGYVAFKVKPNDEVEIGDFILGEASVYFDFDAPVFTNEVSTEFVENLSIASENFSSKIQLYPNPTQDILYIENNSSEKINQVEIYSISGQKILVESHQRQINLGQLNTGIYFVKIITESGASLTQKVVKR